MRLASLLSPELIVCGAAAATYNEVKSLLLARLRESSGTDTDAVAAAIAEREALCSTVVAPGVAFPHARVDVIDDFYMLIATLPAGCRADGEAEPVRFVCMFLMPAGASNLYLRAMASLARFMTTPEALPALMAAETPRQLIKLFDETGTLVQEVVVAEDIMTHNPPVATPETTLRQAADLMVKHATAHLPVVTANGDYLGMVNADRLLRIGLPDYLLAMDSVAFLTDFEPFQDLLKQEQSLTVREVMHDECPRFPAHTPMIVVASRLVREGVPVAPVLAERKLVGTISLLDFVHKVVRA